MDKPVSPSRSGDFREITGLTASQPHSTQTGLPSALKVSIVIAFRNDKENLLACLHSLLDQGTPHEIEMILVDDVSTDSGAEAAGHMFPGARVLSNEKNLGYPRSANRGLRECNGDYAVLVNSDVLVRAGCLKTLVEFMETHPSAGVGGPRILNEDGTLQVSCRRFPTLGRLLAEALALHFLWPGLGPDYPPSSLTASRDVDWITGCLWIVRRAALEQVGLFDEDFFFYGDDVDWCKRSQEAGWTACYVPAAEAVHKGGAASTAKDPVRFRRQLFKTGQQYARKHYGAWGLAACKATQAILLVRRITAWLGLYPFLPSRRIEFRASLHRDYHVLRWLIYPSNEA